jgi:geranylgeranyl pyrophosphate synthase
LIDTGAVAEVKAEIATLAARSVAALDGIAITAEARSALRDLATFVVSRDA